MTSEGRRNGLDCEGGGGSSISTIMGSAGTAAFFRFFGDGSSSSSTSSTITALDPLWVADDPFWKEGNDDCLGGGLGDCEGELTESAPEEPLVEADKWAGGRDLLLP
jgi:hypothetical protein